MVEKRNPDYTASAVKLVNPPEVMDLECVWRSEVEELALIDKTIEESIPQMLRDRRVDIQKRHQETDKAIRTAIDTFGSYQHIEYGFYAVKQAKHTVSLEPGLVRDNLKPELASMVIVEAVDKVKLAGLVKGGFITQEQMDACGIAQISYAYIIR